jgi:bifunctional DNase/RNase
MIETVVESIRVSLVTQTRVVILKEVGGDRHLPIWIGAYEAEAIAMELQGVTASRPLPYDLMRSIITDLGSEVQRVVISAVVDDVFHARIVVLRDSKTIEIDSRSSDAIALAVRVKVPILVADEIMDQAGVAVDSEADDESTPRSSPAREAGAAADQPSPAEEEKLSVFRDFINSLDLDDFDKRQ